MLPPTAVRLVFVGYTLSGLIGALVALWGGIVFVQKYVSHTEIYVHKIQQT